MSTCLGRKAARFSVTFLGLSMRKSPDETGLSKVGRSPRRGWASPSPQAPAFLLSLPVWELGVRLLLP